LQLAQIVQSFNMSLQVVASFHQCGGNVGDTCNTPLPSWVRSVGNSNPDIYYKDSNGSPDVEYLSWGVDNLPLFGGRSPLQIYSDFFESFRANFGGYMPSVINEVQVGLGPAGELRYPGYQSDKWSYCGIGAFQCYDKYMLADLASSAAAAGHSEWGHGGPGNAGSYNSKPPQSTGFFADNVNDNFNSPYGDFFLGWYSQKLIDHGAAILNLARKSFPVSSGVNIAAKVSGIHWWYDTDRYAPNRTLAKSTLIANF
jgi:beta-amylase